MKHVVLTILVSMSFGCATARDWKYTPESRQAIQPTAELAVAVLPFEDRRENVNRNRIMFYLIPLFPYGWAEYETPEGQEAHLTSSLWQFKPADDLSRAVAQEVENARIFAETFQSNRASEGDYVLLGEIESLSYKGKMWSYGFSAYGAYLWLLGLPAASHSNQMTLHLRLAKTPSDPPVWTHTITGETGHTSWIYSMKPDFEYDVLLKAGMADALESLRNAAAQLPRKAPPAAESTVDSALR
jgi:hypothetical protein